MRLPILGLMGTTTHCHSMWTPEFDGARSLRLTLPWFPYRVFSHIFLVGGQVPNVQHFASIAQALTACKADIEPNDLLAPGRKFFWAKHGEDEFVLLPGSGPAFLSPFIYRGQVERHPRCVPVVFRDLAKTRDPRQLSQHDRAVAFVRRIRLAEFIAALHQHPAMTFSKELKLKVRPEALAQHYEMFTDRMDFSQDYGVAAFFATNRRTAKGTWVPMEEGQGVVYRLHYPSLRRALEAHQRGDDLEFIGQQTWPRPGEQKAWTLRLALGRDLEEFPVDVFTFDHHREQGEVWNTHFSGGELLFPEDVLSEVAVTIRDTDSIALRFVSEVLTSFGLRGKLHKRELAASAPFLAQAFGLTVTDREPIGLTEQQLSTAHRRLADTKEAFLADIGVRAVRTVTPEDLKTWAKPRQAEADGGT
jgi:hypothetical protein